MIPKRTTRSVIINVTRLAPAGGATAEPISYHFVYPCRLKAFEALDSTTTTAYAAVYLRKGGTHDVCGLHPTQFMQAFSDGVAGGTTLYQVFPTQPRQANLDIAVDDTFEIIADWYNSVQNDCLFLKLIVEIEEEASTRP